MWCFGGYIVGVFMRIMDFILLLRYFHSVYIIFLKLFICFTCMLFSFSFFALRTFLPLGARKAVAPKSAEVPRSQPFIGGTRANAAVAIEATVNVVFGYLFTIIRPKSDPVFVRTFCRKRRI